MAQGDSYELLVRYQTGGDEAAAEIFHRYVERLVALARIRLSSTLRRRVDPEDVVQSAFRSFFLHARDEAYVLKQSGDLWRLLVQITLHKLYGQAARHHAKRRSVQREESLSGAIDVAAGPAPTPVEIVALVEQLHLVIDRLTSDEQLVLTGRLQGKEMEEIAAAIGKSPRTVRRLMAVVRERMEQQLADSGNAESSTLATRRIRAIDRRVTLQSSEYVLEQLIGTGGMGKVYRARQRATGRKVAVKALRKLYQSDPRAAEQFVQEAEILATLQHPNIVQVHGLGRFPGGGLFIVMEYISGPNLQEQLRRGPVEVQKAIAIFRQVAIAVGRAHEHGIVHADLKPANVLMDGPNRAVVTDFGFARVLVADAPARSSCIGGTIGFMAPEVVRLRQVPTIAADIFGLGALLWALVAGNRPVGMMKNDELGASMSLIEQVCRRCLAEQPRDRYQNVDDLLLELPE